MTNSNTPCAWAKLRASIYRYGGISLWAVLAMGETGTMPVSIVNLLMGILMTVVVASGFPHILAILTGDLKKQQRERQAWAATGFHRVRRFWRAPPRNHPLRELGAVGLDLARARNLPSGRQSGGRKSGAGGHKKPASSGSDDEGDGEPPAHLPLIWTVHDLAATLAVSPKTLQNQPASALPPAIRIPGCKGPRYRLRDVMAWLDGFPAGQRPPKPLPRKVRGRPRIAALRGKGV